MVEGTCPGDGRRQSRVIRHADGGADRHAPPDQPVPAALANAAGSSGVALTSTPNGANASHTALDTATGGATAPPSPTPFTPRGLSGDGECMCTIRIGGMSAATGSA